MSSLYSLSLPSVSLLSCVPGGLSHPGPDWSRLFYEKWQLSNWMSKLKETKGHFPGSSKLKNESKRIKHRVITLRTHKYVIAFRVSQEMKFLLLYLSLNNIQMPLFQCSLREGRTVYNGTYYKGSIGPLFRNSDSNSWLSRNTAQRTPPWRVCKY